MQNLFKKILQTISFKFLLANRSRENFMLWRIKIRHYFLIFQITENIPQFDFTQIPQKPPYICNKCKRNFRRRRQDFLNHLLKSKCNENYVPIFTRKPYICKFCFKKCNYSNWFPHYYSCEKKFKENKFMCNMCFKSYLTKRSVRQHSKVCKVATLLEGMFELKDLGSNLELPN